MTARSAWNLQATTVLFALAHVVDGPVRVDMHEAGLGEGDTLYDTLISTAVWVIVPGYVFMGVGGALHAFDQATRTVRVRRVLATAAIVLFLIGSSAGWGSLLLEIVPGVTFLGLVLGWLWTSWTVLRV